MAPLNRSSAAHKHCSNCVIFFVLETDATLRHFSMTLIWQVLSTNTYTKECKHKLAGRNSSRNRNSRWRQSAIIELLHHDVGQLTKPFRSATSACQILCQSNE